MRTKIEAHRIKCSQLFTELNDLSMTRNRLGKTNMQQVISQKNRELFNATIENADLRKELNKQPRNEETMELYGLLSMIAVSFSEMKNNISTYREINTISLTNALNLEAPGNRSLFSGKIFINERDDYESGPISPRV